jgi:hypothetical protein
MAANDGTSRPLVQALAFGVIHRFSWQASMLPAKGPRGVAAVGKLEEHLHQDIQRPPSSDRARLTTTGARPGGGGLCRV